MRTALLAAVFVAVGAFAPIYGQEPPAPSAVAPQQTGTIIGTVTDAGGAVMPGVTVEATLNGTTRPATTNVTNFRGTYTIAGLTPGLYTLTFKLPGFSTLRRPDVDVTASSPTRIDAQMKIGLMVDVITLAPPKTVCGMTVVPADPAVDPGMRRNAPPNGPKSSIRTIIPDVCRGQ